MSSETRSRNLSRTTTVLMTLMLLQCLTGCTRRFWRLQAENDTYEAISEKLNDSRWQLPRIGLKADPRSRFHNPYDPDCEPLPPDDPAAHKFMHCADGKQGYKHWHDFGDTATVENPQWLEPYSVLINGGDLSASHDQVKIPRVNLTDSLELTYIHSREYQTQLEDVYLTALSLTEQRYLLNTRFRLGGPGLGGALFGSQRGANGRTSHTLNNGIGIQQLLPSGGQFAVDVLNSVTWNPRSGVSATGLAWSLSQPLLEQAGRKVRMESLVQAERNLLYQVRDMARFRQTIFTDVARDYLGLQQASQNIINQENNIRQLKEQIEIGQVEDSWDPIVVREPLARFPDGAEIPESLADQLKYDGQYLSWLGEITEAQKEALLAISDDEVFQSRAQQLIRWRETEVVSLGVAQLITRLNTAQNSLEGSRRVLADDMDDFKIRMGLPPNVEIVIDDTFLAPFELIDGDLLAMADQLKAFAKSKGPSLIPSPRGKASALSLAPPFEELQLYVTELMELRDRIQEVGLEQVKQDFVPVRSILDSTSEDLTASTDGRAFNSKGERDRVIQDVARDLRLYRLNARDFQQFGRGLDLLNELLSKGSPENLVGSLDVDGDMKISRAELPEGWSKLPGIRGAQKVSDADELVNLRKLSADDFVQQIRDAALQIRQDMLQITQGLQVVQAGLRVEAIALNPFSIDGIKGTPTIEQVIELGLKNRHDLMNARAFVMDARRNLEVTANALKALLDLDVSGNVDLDGGNSTDTVNVTLDFKAPLDHIQERNNYNAAQITYQRARRNYMAAEDAVKRSIRGSWRQLIVARQRLEIDRQTVRNAALQYDNVATDLSQNNNLSLLNALDAVLDAQNSLVSDWITYETNRLNIFRDMGIMNINQDGIWTDDFYLQESPSEFGTPEVVEGLMDNLPEDSTSPDLPPQIPPEPQVLDIPQLGTPINE